MLLLEILIILLGSVPEGLKGADCKSAGIAYVGSNPTRPIFIFLIYTTGELCFEIPIICALLFPGATIG